jgi:hypothetical protein
VAHQGSPNFRSIVGVTALVLGALGLGAGLAALGTRRRGLRTR